MTKSSIKIPSLHPPKSPNKHNHPKKSNTALSNQFKSNQIKPKQKRKGHSSYKVMEINQSNQFPSRTHSLFKKKPTSPKKANPVKPTYLPTLPRRKKRSIKPATPLPQPKEPHFRTEQNRKTQSSHPQIPQSSPRNEKKK